jgi:hypothetical protein
MTTKTLNRDAIQILKLLRCGPHVLEVLADANAQLLRDEDAMRRQLAEIAAAEAREFALGVQVEAQAARLKLAMDMRNAMREYIDEDGAINQDDMRRTMAAFDAVPGDVSHTQGLGAPSPSDGEPLPEVDPRPRYASGEVPMVGDVVRLGDTHAETHAEVEGFDIDGDVIVDGDEKLTYKLTLVRRAAPPTPPDWATPWQQSHFAVDPLVLAQAEHIDRLVIQRDAAEALAREERTGRNDAVECLLDMRRELEAAKLELEACWCIAEDKSDVDVPDPFPRGAVRAAVDRQQDREFAAEARADAAQQMVAEMRRLEFVVVGATRAVERVRAASVRELSSTTPKEWDAAIQELRQAAANLTQTG